MQQIRHEHIYQNATFVLSYISNRIQNNAVLDVYSSTMSVLRLGYLEHWNEIEAKKYFWARDLIASTIFATVLSVTSVEVTSWTGPGRIRALRRCWMEQMLRKGMD